jgi:heat shock protein HslJ
MISTKMACPGMPMVEEQAILRLLGQPLTVTAGRDGRLILSAGGARAMILSRERGFPEGS